MPDYKCPQLDNQHFADKIALRAAILDEAKFEEVNVLDLFAGAGHIWTEMGKKFKLTSYLPVDIKPRLPGTLKLDGECAHGAVVQAGELQRHRHGLLRL
jgi:hypothetical protein